MGITSNDFGNMSGYDFNYKSVVVLFGLVIAELARLESVFPASLELERDRNFYDMRFCELRDLYVQLNGVIDNFLERLD